MPARVRRLVDCLAIMAVVAGACLWTPAAAFSLQDALAAAYQTNPQLMAARARLRATDEEVALATAQTRPSISASGSYGVSQGSVTGIGSTFNSHPLVGQVTITQPVYNGGRISAGISRAKADVDAGRQDLAAVEQSVLLDAVQAYLDVIRDQAVLRLNQDYVRTLQGRLDAVQAQHDAGMITRTDVDQARARLSQARAGAASAQSQSEALNDSSWVTFSYTGSAPTVTANVAPGPQGGASTADQIVLNGVNRGVYYATSLTGQNTFSVWVKLANGDGHFDLNYYDGSANHSLAGVATGIWQRFSLTFNGTGSQYANVAVMHDGAQSGNGTFQLWGAQLNPGALPGDYAVTKGHFNVVFTDVMSSASPTADLTINISGGDPAAVAPNTLSFAGGTQCVAVNLDSGAWAHALRIMPLGDSITYGWTDIDYQQGQTNAEDGYRGPLWWNFQTNSMLVDMVGSNTSGDIYLPDHDHAGYPNYRSDQISALLPDLLAANHPDAILLMAGTNDIFQEAQPAQHVVDSITDMIETVRQMSPSTHLYVATLMPINQAKDGQPGDAAMIATVNAAITTAVSQAIAASDNVSLVDMSAMTLSDIADAAHPTADGYAKLAQIWYDAILAQQPNNGGTPGGTSHAIASNVNTVIGSEGDDLLVGSAHASTLNGGGGNDRLVSVSAADVLTGGTGADLFDFSPASGHVTITDFSRAQGDHIELDSFPGLTQFSQLAGHISVSGTTTTIDLSSFGSHTVIDLAHFSGSLSAGDFWLW